MSNWDIKPGKDGSFWLVLKGGLVRIEEKLSREGLQKLARLAWHRLGETAPPGEFGGKKFSLSGDWTEIAPGVRVRLSNAPNEEDMAHYNPQGAVILEVVRRP